MLVLSKKYSVIPAVTVVVAIAAIQLAKAAATAAVVPVILQVDWWIQI